jgi:hypothetical protein
MSHPLVIVADMNRSEIVQLLADADAGRDTGPVRPDGYAVVAYDVEAWGDEEDEDYDEDLDHLEIWGTTATAAEAFDLVGDTLADRFGDTVDEQVEHALEDGVEVNDFDQWFGGDEAAVALLMARPTDGRKMLMFLLHDYYAPMVHFDAEHQPADHYLGTAAKLFTGARLLHGASASPPWHDEAIGVFELQPSDREDGPNSLDERGMAPLHHAVARGEFAEVTALLEAGADPNLQAEYGNSPLFAAIDHMRQTSSVLETLDADRWTLTKVLLDSGADVNSRDRLGRTLVDLAAVTIPYPDTTIGDLHVRGGKSFMLKPESVGGRLGYLDFRKGDLFQLGINEIRYLLEAGAERRGLLHQFLASTGYYEHELSRDRLVAIVELLLSQDVRDEEIDGKTALEHARKWVARGLDHYQAAVDLLEAKQV